MLSPHDVSRPIKLCTCLRRADRCSEARCTTGLPYSNLHGRSGVHRACKHKTPARVERRYPVRATLECFGCLVGESRTSWFDLTGGFRYLLSVIAAMGQPTRCLIYSTFSKESERRKRESRNEPRNVEAPPPSACTLRPPPRLSTTRNGQRAGSLDSCRIVFTPTIWP